MADFKFEKFGSSESNDATFTSDGVQLSTPSLGAVELYPAYAFTFNDQSDINLFGYIASYQVENAFYYSGSIVTDQQSLTVDANTLSASFEDTFLYEDSTLAPTPSHTLNKTNASLAIDVDITFYVEGLPPAQTTTKYLKSPIIGFL